MSCAHKKDQTGFDTYYERIEGNLVTTTMIRTKITLWQWETLGISTDDLRIGGFYFTNKAVVENSRPENIVSNKRLPIIDGFSVQHTRLLNRIWVKTSKALRYLAAIHSNKSSIRT